MNIKATLYSSLVWTLYALAYPVVKFLGFRVHSTAILIYIIARCEGYGRGVSLALVTQSQLETGNFTSEAYLQANNLFGMRHPSRRDTLSQGKFDAGRTHRDLAVFRTKADSIIDRIMWDNEFNNTHLKTDVESYMHEVKNGDGYAVDPDYIKKWKSITPLFDFNLAWYVTAFYATVAIIVLLSRKYRR